MRSFGGKSVIAPLGQAQRKRKAGGTLQGSSQISPPKRARRMGIGSMRYPRWRHTATQKAPPIYLMNSIS